MVLALLKCKLRELWTDTQYWNWFTSEHEVKMVHISALQSSIVYKEVTPMASVHCENESHSSLQHVYDVVFHLPHKSDSSDQFPSTLLNQLQKLYSALSARLPWQWWPTHSTQHPLIPGSQFTAGGLVARIAVSLRESPEWHETHRSFVLQKVLHVRSTFGACHVSYTHGKTEAGGITETVGKKEGFYTSNSWSCSSSMWASSKNCLELPHTNISLK